MRRNGLCMRTKTTIAQKRIEWKQPWIWF
jgi:hypothetical protein